MNRLFQWFQGRSTTFCFLFFVAGNALHCYHKLDATYITFMGTLLGFVVGHSVQENIFAAKTPESPDKG